MEKLPVEDAIHEEVPTNESNSIHDVEASKLNSEAHLEHELTITHVLTHHKALAGWSFFWALCAIGWGFDAQVNGAMISVPAFRRDFGLVLVQNNKASTNLLALGMSTRTSTFCLPTGKVPSTSSAALASSWVAFFAVDLLSALVESPLYY